MSAEPSDQTTADWVSYWNDEAAVWDASPGGSIANADERTAWQAALREHLPPPPADVVDVGTGTGELAFILASLGHRAIGLDFAPDMIANARSKAERISPAPAFQSGDASAPELPPGTLDAVVNRWVLWALPDPIKALTAWRQLLRPGGRLIVVDSWWWVREWIDDPSYRPLLGTGSEVSSDHTVPPELELPIQQIDSLAEIESMARSAGLENVSIDRLRTIEAIWQLSQAGSIMDGLPLHILTATAPETIEGEASRDPS